MLAPDLPGLGGSTFTGPYDVPSLVGELAALVEAEVPGGRVDVVGHDWGGSLALALAGARPDLVRRLVVANAPYRAVPLLRAAHIPFFALPVAARAAVCGSAAGASSTLAFRLGWRPARRWTPRAGRSTAPPTRRPACAAMLGYYRAATRPRAARLLRTLARRSVTHPRRRASRPRRRSCCGAPLDPVLPVSTGEAVVRDLGADCVMVTVPGAGHFVIEEAPEVVADVLLDFLADAVTPAPVPAAPPERPGAEDHVIEPAARRRRPASTEAVSSRRVPPSRI